MALSAQDLRDYAWVEKWVQKKEERKEWSVQAWQARFMKLSRSLSYMLRHGAAENGLLLNRDGSIELRELLEHPQFKEYALDEFIATVKHNAKKRFELLGDKDDLRVRCLQGHSQEVGDLDMDRMMTPITLDDVPPVAIHATFRSNTDSIQKHGLKVQTRMHIHMATGLPSDGSVISGCRDGTDRFLYIDVAAAIKDGVKFFRSGNDVILTSGVNGVLDAKYILGCHDKRGFTLWGSIPGRGESKRRTPGLEPDAKAAPAEPKAAAAPKAAPSQYSSHEKNFLKEVKAVRAILKLEAQKAENKTLDKTQEKKLAGKGDALAFLSTLESCLDADSELREKNPDIMEVLNQYRGT